MSIEWTKSTKPNERRCDCVICHGAIMANEANYCWAPNPDGRGYIRAHAACVEHQDPGARRLEDILEEMCDELHFIRECFDTFVKHFAAENPLPPEGHP